MRYPYERSAFSNELTKSRNETIKFDGDKLDIEVDNSGGDVGLFRMCVRTSMKSPSDECPDGYRQLAYYFGDKKVRKFQMNRQGEVFGMGLVFNLESVLFNEDDTLNVFVDLLPNPSTIITLLNAERYVPPEPTDTTTTGKSSKATAIGITVGVIMSVIVVVAIIATVVGMCIYCRKKTQKEVDPPQITIVQKAPTMVEKRDTSPKASIKTPETTKNTSHEPSTKPSQPRMPPTKIATKPQSPATVPTAAKSPSFQAPPTPSAESAPPPSAEPATAPPVNSTEPTKTNEDGPSSKPDKNKSLKVEKTQTETPPSPPTPPHENFVIRLRCKCRPHDVSDLEKAILKRTKEVAVHAADMLIEHLKKELAEYGFERQSGLQQPDRLWKHIDDEATMTSLFYYMMILVKPSLFKVQRQGVHDKDVEITP
uniref:CUB domain-containing protein n=1 Tax=Panagrellus redivivus TaxID=6233 RepID=A0A7E4V889_PANRE